MEMKVLDGYVRRFVEAQPVEEEQTDAVIVLVARVGLSKPDEKLKTQTAAKFHIHCTSHPSY